MTEIETLRRAAALIREQETEPWKLAVASLLNSEARGLELAAEYGGGVPHSQDHAVTVARAYLEAPRTWTTDQVEAALNSAADDILEATEAEDEGLRDALNLLVNAALSYLTGEAADLEGVAEKNYDADLSSILSWIRQGIR